MRYPLGEGVEFISRYVPRYACYGVQPGGVYHVAHIERRGRRRVLYLWRTDGEWIPTFPSHVQRARKRRHAIKTL